METKEKVVALPEFGVTVRQEEGGWISYPTNIGGTCDFDEGTAVAVSDWENSTTEEIDRLLALLDDAVAVDADGPWWSRG
jgi:hypothetical protein